MSDILFYYIELLDVFNSLFMAFGIAPIVGKMLESRKKYAIDIGILSTFLVIGILFTYMLLFLDFYLAELLSLVEFVFEMVLFAVVAKLNYVSKMPFR